MSSPQLESEWVPLANTFSKNLAKLDQQDPLEFSFAVTRGTSDAHLVISFKGNGEDGDYMNEEMSFDKLASLHR